MKLTNKDDKNLKLQTPKSVFFVLYEQLKWSFKNNFLNAISISIRSFFEQLIIWSYWYTIDDKKLKKDYVYELCKHRINELYNSIIHHNFAHDKRWNYNNDIEKKLFESILIEQNDIDKIIEDFNLIINSKHYFILDEFIHALHRMSFEQNFNEYLSFVKLCFEFIENIMSRINFDKFDNLDKLILLEINGN